MKYLDKALEEYGRSDVYPFHMPGHKRRMLDFPNPYTVDITEIEGFDHLHHAQGILKEAQERAAELYGGEYCYYLVNGSTGGLLSAICAATKKRDKVLVARNCHKAVYHALALNELTAEYLYPAITVKGLQGQVQTEQVRRGLAEHPDTAAVIITSPTYEGIVSDIAGIAAVCHEFCVPLIVDEAHGAHFGFGAGFPENAVRLGADAVIMSLHKTMPSFTQTALLHINSKLLNKERIEKYLDIFQTSSPSYLFMAGMDACIRMVSQKGRERFEHYRELLDNFYRESTDLKHLHVMHRADLREWEACEWDDSKLVIFAGSFGGTELYRELLFTYHLQMEMVSATYVLGMTSMMDTEEGFERLIFALHEIDAALSLKRRQIMCGGGGSKKTEVADFAGQVYGKRVCRMQIYQAQELPSREVDFDDAQGQISADYVYLYPPGIPLIVPGEEICSVFTEQIREYHRMGLCVEGGGNLSLERIKIVYF